MAIVKRSSKLVGQVGFALCGLGVLCAIMAAVTSRSNPALAPWLIAGGMFIYLPGGLAVVAAFGYSRGSKPYLAMMIMRIIFAFAVMLSLIGIIGGPV